MADWTPPPYPQLVAGKPWTDEKASAAFENVEALAEGAPDAPRVQGRALGGVSLGAVQVTSVLEPEFTDLEGMVQIRVDFLAANSSGGTQNLEISFSTDNGATYGSFQDLLEISNGGASGSFRLDLQTGTGFRVMAVTVPSKCNAIKFGIAVSSASAILDAYCLGGIE